ncbi:MAG: hypothetical protein SOW25_03455 [Helicobacter sp.]|nr:hypothetical protein [Helicobacteraceae bacterium]MDY3113367.1 hypothetical protein [Helicobacter sp.]
MVSGISNGLYGNAMYNAQSGISNNMQNIDNANNQDLMQSIPQQIVAQNGVDANAQSAKTQDSMYQSLLDIKA